LHDFPKQHSARQLLLASLLGDITQKHPTFRFIFITDQLVATATQLFSQRIEEEKMTSNAAKQTPIISLSVAIPTFAVAGIAITSWAVEDRAMALLHVGSSLVSSLHIGSGVNPAAAAAVAFVLFLVGVVSGLSGFAFSAVAACILWLLPPLQAVPLIMLLSVCNQLLSVGTLRREIVLRSTPEREGALAYIAGGLVGVPMGLELLQALPTRLSGGGLGLFLLIYSVLVLLKPDRLRIRLSGWKPAVAVGTAGGIVGGFSAFPGSIPVVYLGLRGLSKTETRSITQPYILALQLTSLSILTLTRSSIFNTQFWLLWALTLPAVLLGTSTGLTLYRRFSEVNFRRAVLILLMVSGVSLLVKALI
jgi:uncharacterized membrane protein YfcA